MSSNVCIDDCSAASFSAVIIPMSNISSPSSQSDIRQVQPFSPSVDVPMVDMNIVEGADVDPVVSSESLMVDSNFVSVSEQGENQFADDSKGSKSKSSASTTPAPKRKVFQRNQSRGPKPLIDPSSSARSPSSASGKTKKTIEQNISRYAPGQQRTLQPVSSLIYSETPTEEDALSYILFSYNLRSHIAPPDVKQVPNNPFSLFAIGEAGSKRLGVWRKTPDLFNLLAVEYSEPSRRCHYVGLRNLGATCYMNCYLQTLFMNLDFRAKLFAARQQEIVKDKQSASDTSSRDVKPDTSKLLPELQLLFTALQSGMTQSADPTGVAKALKIATEYQEDATEFATLLLTTLEKELGCVASSMNFIPELFRGRQRQSMICESCGGESERTDDFYELRVRLPSPIAEFGTRHQSGELSGRRRGRKRGIPKGRTKLNEPETDMFARSLDEENGESGKPAVKETDSGSKSFSILTESIEETSVISGGSSEDHETSVSLSTVSSGQQIPCNVPVFHLEEGLQQLFQSELLYDDNRYMCIRCNDKVDALRRISLASLPPYLHICCERYAYDGTGRKKLTIPMDYPLILDLKDYCSEISSEKKSTDENIDKQMRDMSFTGELKINDEKSIEATENIQIVNSLDSNNQRCDKTMNNNDDVLYELIGILEHHGQSAQSGHYIAYLKDMTAKQIPTVKQSQQNERRNEEQQLGTRNVLQRSTTKGFGSASKAKGKAKAKMTGQKVGQHSLRKRRTKSEMEGEEILGKDSIIETRTEGIQSGKEQTLPPGGEVPISFPYGRRKRAIISKGIKGMDDGILGSPEQRNGKKSDMRLVTAVKNPEAVSIEPSLPKEIISQEESRPAAASVSQSVESERGREQTEKERLDDILSGANFPPRKKPRYHANHPKVVEAPGAHRAITHKSRSHIGSAYGGYFFGAPGPRYPGDILFPIPPDYPPSEFPEFSAYTMFPPFGYFPPAGFFPGPFGVVPDLFQKPITPLPNTGFVNPLNQVPTSSSTFTVSGIPISPTPALVVPPTPVFSASPETYPPVVPGTLVTQSVTRPRSASDKPLTKHLLLSPIGLPSVPPKPFSPLLEPVGPGLSEFAAQLSLQPYPTLQPQTGLQQAQQSHESSSTTVSSSEPQSSSISTVQDPQERPSSASAENLCNGTSNHSSGIKLVGWVGSSVLQSSDIELSDNVISVSATSLANATANPVRTTATPTVSETTTTGVSIEPAVAGQGATSALGVGGLIIKPGGIVVTEKDGSDRWMGTGDGLKGGRNDNSTMSDHNSHDEDCDYMHDTNIHAANHGHMHDNTMHDAVQDFIQDDALAPMEDVFHQVGDEKQLHADEVEYTNGQEGDEHQESLILMSDSISEDPLGSAIEPSVALIETNENFNLRRVALGSEASIGARIAEHKRQVSVPVQTLLAGHFDEDEEDITKKKGPKQRRESKKQIKEAVVEEFVKSTQESVHPWNRKWNWIAFDDATVSEWKIENGLSTSVSAVDCMDKVDGVNSGHGINNGMIVEKQKRDSDVLIPYAGGRLTSRTAYLLIYKKKSWTCAREPLPPRNMEDAVTSVHSRIVQDGDCQSLMAEQISNFATQRKEEVNVVIKQSVKSAQAHANALKEKLYDPSDERPLFTTILRLMVVVPMSWWSAFICGYDFPSLATSLPPELRPTRDPKNPNAAGPPALPSASLEAPKVSEIEIVDYTEVLCIHHPQKHITDGEMLISCKDQWKPSDHEDEEMKEEKKDNVDRLLKEENSSVNPDIKESITETLNQSFQYGRAYGIDPLAVWDGKVKIVPKNVIRNIFKTYRLAASIPEIVLSEVVCRRCSNTFSQLMEFLFDQWMVLSNMIEFTRTVESPGVSMGGGPPSRKSSFVSAVQTSQLLQGDSSDSIDLQVLTWVSKRALIDAEGRYTVRERSKKVPEGKYDVYGAAEDGRKEIAKLRERCRRSFRNSSSRKSRSSAGAEIGDLSSSPSDYHQHHFFPSTESSPDSTDGKSPSALNDSNGIDFTDGVVCPHGALVPGRKPNSKVLVPKSQLLRYLEVENLRINLLINGFGIAEPIALSTKAKTSGFVDVIKWCYNATKTQIVLPSDELSDIVKCYICENELSKEKQRTIEWKQKMDEEKSLVGEFIYRLSCKLVKPDLRRYTPWRLAEGRHYLVPANWIDSYFSYLGAKDQDSALFPGTIDASCLLLPGCRHGNPPRLAFDPVSYLIGPSAITLHPKENPKHPEWEFYLIVHESEFRPLEKIYGSIDVPFFNVRFVHIASTPSVDESQQSGQPTSDPQQQQQLLSSKPSVLVRYDYDEGYQPCPECVRSYRFAPGGIGDFEDIELRLKVELKSGRQVPRRHQITVDGSTEIRKLVERLMALLALPTELVLNGEIQLALEGPVTSPLYNPEYLVSRNEGATGRLASAWCHLPLHPDTFGLQLRELQTKLGDGWILCVTEGGSLMISS